MKKVLFSCCLFTAFFVSAQKTVQFGDPLPPNYNASEKVSEKHFGDYKSTNSETTYRFDAKGIHIISTIVAYVTREQLRESATIEVRNGHLFGIDKNRDSVPCFLEGERYYYGIQHVETIIGSGSLHQLSRIDDNTFIINFHEGKYFEPSLLRFEKGGITIVHGELAYQSFFEQLLHVTSFEQYGSTVDVVIPRAEQWSRLKELLFAGEALNYLKVTE